PAAAPVRPDDRLGVRARPRGVLHGAAGIPVARLAPTAAPGGLTRRSNEETFTAMAARARVSPLRRKLRTKVVATILDAAEQVALEAGLGGMTIGAVAERAGVAVGTLYNYFSNGEA